MITALDAEGVDFTIEWDEALPPPLPPLHLLIGLCRPATAKKILTEATTLGVASMTFFEAEKSDPAFARSSLWESRGEGTEAEWAACVRQGAEQAFATRLPEVHRCRTFEEALVSLPARARRLAPDVYEATARLGASVGESPEPTVLAFGPERGWGARDRRQLREFGFTLVSLGSRVLRVETAVTVALAQVLGRWGVI